MGLNLANIITTRTENPCIVILLKFFQKSERIETKTTTENPIERPRRRLVREVNDAALHIPADQDAVPHIPADQDAAPVVQNPLEEPPQPHIDLDAITDQVTRAVMEKFESIHSINTSITTRSSGTSFIDLDKGFNSQIMNVSNELGYDVQNSVKMKIINNEHVNLGRELHKLQVQDNRLQHPVVMFQTANQCSALSKIAYTPVNPWVLKKMLNSYPNQSDAELLFNGFLNGFKLNYDGPRQATDCQNLKS
ncbi:hypothetical protein KUTeg_008073, partial [Tegillarca granosa]